LGTRGAWTAGGGQKRGAKGQGGLPHLDDSKNSCGGGVGRRQFFLEKGCNTKRGERFTYSLLSVMAELNPGEGGRRKKAVDLWED